MLNIIDRIHYVSTPVAENENEIELVLASRRQKVFNPFFVMSIVLFVGSMIFKANVDNRLAAIPLGISTIILLSAVWRLSANGMVIFSTVEHKAFRVYKHLGYVQKIYVIPLQSIDKATRFENKNTGVYLQLDNLNTVLICRDKELKDNEASDLVERINNFLKKI